MSTETPIRAIDLKDIEIIPLEGRAGDNYPATDYEDLVFFRFIWHRGPKDRVYLVIQCDYKVDIGNGVVVYTGRLDIFDQKLKPTMEDIVNKVASEAPAWTAFVGLRWRNNYALHHFEIVDRPFTELNRAEIEEALSRCEHQRLAQVGALMTREALSVVIDDGFGTRLPKGIVSPEEAHEFVANSRKLKDNGGFESLSAIWPEVGEGAVAFAVLERFYDHNGFGSESEGAPVFMLRNQLGHRLFRLWPVDAPQGLFRSTQIVTCGLYPGTDAPMEVELRFYQPMMLMMYEFINKSAPAVKKPLRAL